MTEITMPKKSIAQKDVFDICDSLYADGKDITIRGVHSKSGGSLTTVSNFVNQWHEQNRLADIVESDISEGLQKAILAEMGLATEKVKKKLMGKLNTYSEQIKEMQGLLSEHENTIEELKTVEEKRVEQEKQELLKKEKVISTLEAKLGDAIEREKDLQKQLEVMRDKFHEADKKSAIAESHRKELEKRLELG